MALREWDKSKQWIHFCEALLGPRRLSRPVKAHTQDWWPGCRHMEDGGVFQEGWGKHRRGAWENAKSQLLHNCKRCRCQPQYRFISRSLSSVGDAKSPLMVSILSFKAILHVILTLKFTFCMAEFLQDLAEFTIKRSQANHRTKTNQTNSRTWKVL